jgi:hypothetical protein
MTGWIDRGGMRWEKAATAEVLVMESETASSQCPRGLPRQHTTIHGYTLIPFTLIPTPTTVHVMRRGFFSYPINAYSEFWQRKH